MDEKKTDIKKDKPALYSKQQILNSKTWHWRADIVSAVLKDGEVYTVKQVEQMVKDYMKGKVN